MTANPPTPTFRDDPLPGVIFAMRYSNAIGYVHSSMARTYDRTAKLLLPQARSYIAYPRLTDRPAYIPEVLNPVEADFHCKSESSQQYLASLIKERNIRVVMFMACMPYEVNFQFFRDLGVRTINGEQDSYPPDARQHPLKRLAKRLFRSYLKWNIHDLYVANAEHQKQFLLSFAGLPASRIQTVVNGIDAELFSPGPKPDPESLGLPRTEHYAITICQARAEKRVDFLLDVARKVFATNPELSLTFVHVGGGECWEAWKAKAEAMGLNGKFCFAGPHNDVLPFHRLASFLVHAADRESFGLVLTEAMAVGKPVIATAARGPAEIVVDGQTGYLIGKDDAEGFARAVTRLCANDALRKQFGVAGRERVLERYTVDRQAQGFAQAILSQLSGQHTERFISESVRARSDQMVTHSRS